MRTTALLLLLPGLLQVQAQATEQAAAGRLYYTTAAGRALTFRVVAAGPGRMTLAPEAGDAARVRAQVMVRIGDQQRLAPGAITMTDPLPVGWQGGAPGSHLIQTADGTIFWRHAPNQVLPARFTLGGVTWRLLAAELPAGRTF